MPCFHPLQGYRSRQRTPSGKRGVVFSPREGWSDLPVSVPCGQCIGCRLERSRQWAVRCMHEAQLHRENCFLTLTYDDEHLPLAGSLDRAAFPKFMKRLRSRFADKRVRYFHCGEYGDVSGRPHYHACLFGFDFPDKYPWTIRTGHPVWRSESLESLWPCGQSEIGTVTFESAAYVARYITKKVTGVGAAAHYERVVLETGEVVVVEPEYTTMSRRPGIGREWYDRFKSEVFPADEVVSRGLVMKPPRFYDKLYEVSDPDGFELVVRRRRGKVKKCDTTEARLGVQEECAVARLESFGERTVV